MAFRDGDRALTGGRRGYRIERGEAIVNVPQQESKTDLVEIASDNKAAVN